MNPSHQQVYREYAKQDSDLPLFYQPWWLDHMAPGWEVALHVEENRILGAWPYYFQQGRGISQCINPPFTPYLGPWICYPSKQSAQYPLFENQVVQALLETFPFGTYTHLGCWPGLFPLAVLSRFQVQVRQTYMLHLDREEAEIWAGMGDSMRRRLRRNQGKSYREDVGNWSDFWRFREETLKRKGQPTGPGPAGLPGLLKEGQERGQMQILGAYEGDQCLAIAWIAWDHQRAYYLGGARNPDQPTELAQAQLVMSGILQARRRGLQYFDFEGSMDPGVERFFQRFGAQRHPYMVLKRPGPLWWQGWKTLARSFRS